MAEEKLIGKTTHYFNKIQVGIIELTEEGLKVGDEIHIKGGMNDFNQKIDSMQIEHKDVQEAKKGETVGIKVDQPVKENYEVYKVIE